MTDQLDRLKTALADRYTIERELGRGGMAVVFLAHDQKLGRDVALKVLRPELAASLGGERFLREIEIAAKLTHPNILALYDCGEADGQLYYTMPYVEGESLRDRLAREKQLSVEDALQITREVGDALGHAHSLGIVHRDIKPENILFTAGHAVVADFGIARAVTEAGAQTLTETGLAVGTPAYMSPEQATGVKDIDARSDLYSLGCVLYEMLSGETPYTAPTPQALIAKKLSEPTPRVSVVRDLVSAEVEAALTKALAKTPADRYPTAQQFTQALTTSGIAIAPVPKAPAVAEEPRRAEAVGAPNLRWLMRPRVALPAVVVVLASALFAVRFFQHRAEVRWARGAALPEIERLIGENDLWRNLVPPYRLAERAEAILGNDPKLAELFSRVSLEIDVLTTPPGARVYVKEYETPDAEWSFLGVSPLEHVRVPIGIFRWKIEKEGYETVLAAASTWDLTTSGDNTGTPVPYELARTLDPEGGVPPGMVRVQAAETTIGTLGDFFIGRYEVTNREYKAFVDAGGYRNREYWKHPFLKDGRQLTWDEAVKEFVDQSDQPGPSTWLGGDYPQDQGEYPVSGVSWYEAAAYAEYADRSLPTSAHWNVARGRYTPMLRWPQLGGFAVLAPFSNFRGQGPVPVGSLQGLTAYGAFDMAGNVREWCWNETPQGRLIRGGAWNDNTYEFNHARQAPPMDRSERNGFRLAVYPAPEMVPDAAFGFQQLSVPSDLRARQPVSDAVFQVYREQFAYDPTPLNARVEHRDESPAGWIREKISFDAAYGGERVLAYLFLPANARPPFQTVIYFPGAASAWMRSSENLESYYEFPLFLSFLVRNGRAVLYPVYKGTFERGNPALNALKSGAESHAYTEYLVQVVKDLRRSVDYLETREDIDSGRLAYYGMSWGAALGAIIPAVEERLGSSILVAGGFNRPARPEAHQINYVTRVRTPTLMLNGRYDNIRDVDEEVRPMFDLLGTPVEHKRLILYDTDHIPPRTEYIKETLAWLDKYLGPVGR